MSLCLEIAGTLQPKHVGYGLPCANCRAYYAANIAVCPVCGCHDRVLVKRKDVRAPRRKAIPMTTTIRCPAIRVPGDLHLAERSYEERVTFGKEREMGDEREPANFSYSAALSARSLAAETSSGIGRARDVALADSAHGV